MKIITIGNGLIGSHLPYERATDRLKANENYLNCFIDNYKPDVIINATGFCGRPNVDNCESEKTKTYMSNVVIPSMLAQSCLNHDIRMINIGSGCVYFGDSPNYKYIESDDNFIKTDLGWKEDDFANPKSYYSKTKYACDLAIGSLPNVATLRIRMPISSQNNERNFINKIRGYSNIIDIPNSVSFLDDFVRCVDWVIKENITGIYHITNPDPISAADVMREYQKYDKNHKFNIINEQELDSLTIAKRSNCYLDTNKLNQAGFQMTPSDEALKKCMAQYIKNI